MIHVEVLQQPSGFGVQTLTPRQCLGAAAGRKARGQDHIVDHREIRNQVDHLEDLADVISFQYTFGSGSFSYVITYVILLGPD